MNKETYLQSVPDDNIDFVAQQLLLNCDLSEILLFEKAFKDLEKLLYKSWSKEMPFNDIQTAIARAAIIELNEQESQKEK